jgi:predicted enzyme related to lactoylglutathione lyase
MAQAPAGRFRWVDLAAADAPRATGFYTDLFGWSARPQAANGGTFVRLTHAGRDIGSLYQMQQAQRDAGIASHWTPYVQVDDVAAASRRAALLGASIAVEPFCVEGMARIALIVDPVGAELGLWEDPRCK